MQQQMLSPTLFRFMLGETLPPHSGRVLPCEKGSLTVRSWPLAGLYSAPQKKFNALSNC